MHQERTYRNLIDTEKLTTFRVVVQETDLAISENAGRGLLTHTDQIIVENGGDVFIKADSPVTVGIFAGYSPLSMQIGIQLNCENKPTAVCTSSGTLGHSLSLGKADAVCVVADSGALADAAATSIGNRIQSEADINTAITAGQRIAEIAGIVIIAGEKIGVWGDLEIVSINSKIKDEFRPQIRSVLVGKKG
jgi:ApbE superfamily uncharacterized protein (UPF0280 family)